MPLIRTDRAAIVTGAVIVALFQLLVVRTGLVIAAQDRTSLDAWVLLSLSAGVMYGVLFAFGHALLRARGVRSRAMYAGLGAIAATPPFLLAIGGAALRDAWNGGTISLILIVPLAAGALVGFLYHRRAGYEVSGDDPAALAAVHQGEGRGAPDPAHITTEDADYFGGPLVVRTSIGAIAIASLLGSAVLMLAILFGARLEPDGSPLTQYLAAVGPGKATLQAIIGGAIPIALLLWLAHTIIRAMRKSSWQAYAFAGAIGPVLFSVLLATTGMSLFAFVFMVQYLAPSLVAMLAFRALAGMEPAPLPDDIEVSDRRTLVGENHVRRGVARVIDTSSH